MRREPLLHFAVAGAILFAARAMLAPSPPADLQPATLVDGDAVETEALRRESRFALAAGSVDRSALHAELAQEEQRLFDARALGLDQSDLVIRRRLAQKMELVIRAELDPSIDTEVEVERALEAAIQARIGTYRVIRDE